MSALNDLTGQKFGRLTVIERGENSGSGATRWVCECECGARPVAFSKNLKNGHTKSCGCAQKEATSRANTKHGQRMHPLYRVWKRMKYRCYGKRSADFDRYGGRGITVCERWKDDPQAFIDDMGASYAPGLQIDRIDNDGPYSPENCRWATPTVNSNNRRDTRYIMHKGKPTPLSFAASDLGLDRVKLWKRSKAERLFVTPDGTPTT